MPLPTPWYTSAMREGDVLEIEVGKSTLDGRGEAALEDRRFLIEGAFAGETARARLLVLPKRGSKAFGRALEILQPHPGRREAPCHAHTANAGQCTGCPLMELDEPAQRELKLEVLRGLGLEVSILHAADRPLGYRYSSKRVVSRVAGRVRLGSFQRGSHRFADMRGCLVEHHSLRRAADEVTRIASSLEISVYNETSQTGLLRYVWLKTNGSDVVVTLVGAAPPDGEARRLANRLPVQAVGWSVQSSTGNAIRGSAAELLAGELPDALDFLSFGQPNPAIAQQMYTAAISDEGGLLRGSHAWDLFAGTGTTTRQLQQSFAQVEACESFPESAAALGIAPQSAADFLASKPVGDGAPPDFVLANPPRKGLGAGVAAELNRIGAPRLHILSCGPEGLARDLKQLNRYRLESLEAFETLPQTMHVELVARLVRAPEAIEASGPLT